MDKRFGLPALTLALSLRLRPIGLALRKTFIRKRPPRPLRQKEASRHFVYVASTPPHEGINILDSATALKRLAGLEN
jgi:hypothetical protein